MIPYTSLNKSFEILAIFMHASINKFNESIHKIDSSTNSAFYEIDPIDEIFEKFEEQSEIIFDEHKEEGSEVDNMQIFNKALCLLQDCYISWK